MKTTTKPSGTAGVGRRLGGDGRQRVLRGFCVAMAGMFAPAMSLHGFETRDLFAFSAGPVVLKPSLSVVTGYNDNIYSLPADSPLEDLGLIESRDDLNFVLSPGLKARLGRTEAPNWVELGYRFDQVLYLQNTDADSSNHNFDLGAAAAGSRLSYDCRNSFQILNSIMTGSEATLDGVVIPPGNVERNYYMLGHNLAYDLTAKSRLKAHGALSIREYPDGDRVVNRFVDSLDWRVRTGYDYAITEKTRLGALLHWGQQLQSASGALGSAADADVYGASLTAMGAVTSKLSGNLRVGYEYRDFSAGGGSGGVPIAGLGLSQAFSERTALGLNYNRGGSVAAGSGEPTITDSVGLTFQQRMGARHPWFFNAGVSYVHNEYSETGVGLDNLQLTAGLTYPIRSWARAFLNYSFELGDRDTYDYQVNQVSIGLNLGL